MSASPAALREARPEAVEAGAEAPGAEAPEPKAKAVKGPKPEAGPGLIVWFV